MWFLRPESGADTGKVKRMVILQWPCLQPSVLPRSIPLMHSNAKQLFSCLLLKPAVVFTEWARGSPQPLLQIRESWDFRKVGGNHLHCWESVSKRTYLFIWFKNRRWKIYMSICVCTCVYILSLLELELRIFGFPYSLLIDFPPCYYHMIHPVMKVEISKNYFSLALTLSKLQEAQTIE